MASSVLAFDDVQLSFAGKDSPVNVLRGVRFGVTAGEAVAGVGPSGSGKSSRMMLAAGLERASSGDSTSMLYFEFDATTQQMVSGIILIIDLAATIDRNKIRTVGLLHDHGGPQGVSVLPAR